MVRTSAAEMYDAHVLKNYARPALTLVRGSGTRVWDDQGNAYLDFSSGIAVSSLGHCHPHWVAAVRRQAGELNHTSNLFRNTNQGELARRLVGLAGPGRVFFCNCSSSPACTASASRASRASASRSSARSRRSTAGCSAA